LSAAQIVWLTTSWMLNSSILQRCNP
jgi:hypothetical protein